MDTPQKTSTEEQYSDTPDTLLTRTAFKFMLIGVPLVFAYSFLAKAIVQHLGY